MLDIEKAEIVDAALSGCLDDYQLLGYVLRNLR
jgi:hypothetical protein